MSQINREATLSKLSCMVDRLDNLKRFEVVLAHDYDDIAPHQVYAALQKALTQYPQYVRAIQTDLDTLED